MYFTAAIANAGAGIISMYTHAIPFLVVVAALFTVVLSQYGLAAALLSLGAGAAAGAVYAAALMTSVVTAAHVACAITAAAMLALTATFDDALALELGGAYIYLVWATRRIPWAPAADLAGCAAILVVVSTGARGHALIYVMAHALVHVLKLDPPPSPAEDDMTWATTVRQWASPFKGGIRPTALTFAACAGAGLALGGWPGVAVALAAHMLVGGPQTWRGIGDAAGVALFAASATWGQSMGLRTRHAVYAPLALFYIVGVVREAVVGDAPAGMPLFGFYGAWLPRWTARIVWCAGHLLFVTMAFAVLSVASFQPIVDGVTLALSGA